MNEPTLTTHRELTLPDHYRKGRSIRQGVCMIYLILVVAFMITSGIVLANYELYRTRRERVEKLRQRARRCIRRAR